MKDKKMIFRGETIVVYIDDVSPSKVIFAFTGFEGEPGKSLYGDGFVQKCGFTGVFFVSLQNHWWQTPELDAAIAAANHHTQEHDVRVAYGQSMGGYGALLCARRLNSRAVVTSPQTTVNPDLASIGDVWLENIRKSPIIRDNVLEELADTASAVIIYDNKGPSDVSHVRHVEARNSVALYKIPYATHNLPAALLEMGVLSKMIAGFFESERGYDRAAFRQLIKGNRDSSFTYLNRLGFYAKRAKSKWLFDYYKKCVVARLSAKIGEAAFPASARIGTDLFRINSHVELFDEATKLFVAKGNDPQVIFRNLPEIAATGVLTFYASSASTGNLFFSRTVEDKFSAADSMKFKVAAGVNVVRFDASQLSSEPLRTIRFDPMSRDGYFSVLALSYGAGEQVDQGALAVSAS